MDKQSEPDILMTGICQRDTESVEEQEIDSIEECQTSILPAETEARKRFLFKIFKGRHIQMMALGVSIGTGVLFESGYTLSLGGPVCTTLAYLWTGTVLYAIMATLGEMISFLPIPGAVFTLANRVLSPAIGFAAGYSYIFGYALDYPNKAVATTNFINFWTTTVPPAALITIFLIIPILFNLFNVRRYGEIEFWMTSVKVTTIVGLIFLGILLPMGASPNPPLLGTSAQYSAVDCSENTIGDCLPTPGFNYWRQAPFKSYILGGAAGRLIAFWECSCRAVFSYTGNEIVGITADETERQRETLPRAVKRVSGRIIFYYVGAILVLGLNLSADDPMLTSRLYDNSVRHYPGSFIIMIERASIPGLSHLINVVMIIAAVSVSNADLYVTSRSLYALAWEGHAPKFLLRKNYFGVPYRAVLVSALPGALAYMDLKVASNNVFGFLSSMTTTAILIPWAIICLTYLRLRRAVVARRMKSLMVPEARSRFQPWLAIYGLTCCVFLILFQGFKAFTRHNEIWSAPGDSWGFTLGPFAFIAVFFIILTMSRVIFCRWTWDIPKLSKVDIINGVAPKLEPLKREESGWRRLISGILNAL